MAEELQRQIIELTGALNALVAQTNEQQRLIGELRQGNARPETRYIIPDPIKLLPTFDGNKKQLNQWLKSAKDTFAIFDPTANEIQRKIYLQAVIGKITGTARDLICVADEVTNFNQVEALLTHALGDRREITAYKSQLWQTRMTDKIDLHTFYKKVCEIEEEFG